MTAVNFRDFHVRMQLGIHPCCEVAMHLPDAARNTSESRHSLIDMQRAFHTKKYWDCCNKRQYCLLP